MICLQGKSQFAPPHVLEDTNVYERDKDARTQVWTKEVDLKDFSQLLNSSC